jgi:hypothetical protein
MPPPFARTLPCSHRKSRPRPCFRAAIHALSSPTLLDPLHALHGRQADAPLFPAPALYMEGKSVPKSSEITARGRDCGLDPRSPLLSRCTWKANPKPRSPLRTRCTWKEVPVLKSDMRSQLLADGIATSIRALPCSRVVHGRRTRSPALPCERVVHGRRCRRPNRIRALSCYAPIKCQAGTPQQPKIIFALSIHLLLPGTPKII